MNRLYKHYNRAIGSSFGASASGTSENSGNNDTSMSYMISGFGSAKERIRSIIPYTSNSWLIRIVWNVNLSWSDIC